MKPLILAMMVLFATTDLAAQVIFRNDFVITNRKQHRIENRGITYVTINVGRGPNFNQLIDGRGGKTLVIDVGALRNAKAKYSYAEIADRIYTPPVRTLQHYIHDPSLNHNYFLRSLSFRPLLHDL